MEASGTIRKVKSNMNFTTSAMYDGRASPMGALRNSKSRPMSPAQAVARSQVNLKRPPSAARVLDVSRKLAPALEHRSYSSNVAGDGILTSRSTSSLSNRSVLPSAGKGAENTIVSIRVRPPDIRSHNQSWLFESREKYIRSATSTAGPPLEFVFDNVFAENDTNKVIYDSCVKTLVAGVVDGFHGTVFAYGMTGTGKTYSMQGLPKCPGIIPQAVQDMFDTIDRDDKNRYNLRMSYLEIYNEKIRDLLSYSLEETEEIKIRDDPKRGMHAYPLTEIPINSITAFLDTLDRGNNLRHSAATDFNAHSSRSHAVVQIIVESTPCAMGLELAQVGGTARVSTLNLIDLAGSEKASADLERRKEGSYINKSLLTLGTVIARLTSPTASVPVHVPFRDSKLTRLLQHALSGLSLVSILATINTDSAHTMETTNTLKFAARAKYIPGKAKKAELFGGDMSLLIESLRSENQSLRAQLSRYQASNSISSTLNLHQEARTLSSSPGNLQDIHEDETAGKQLIRRLEAMEQEKAESDAYIKTLQGELLRYQDNSADRGPSGSINSPSLQRSPPGNFSYPFKHEPRSPTDPTSLIGPRPADIDQARVGQDGHEDRLNALADKELAANVLTKSQRSRDEARDLSAQIAQLKKREDKKSFVSRLGFQHLSKPLTGDDGKENGTDLMMRRTSPRALHTLVSPSIRAPREAGFF